ncbi:protocatechuate 3,4-dioxygenase beta subunit [Microbacterium testaceum]|uniref:intradiol ring-cleavage dioxygenase n=1 Tax=Microbacterium TaxID=33882 RepID=UPI00226D99AF|nr:MULTISPECIES: intradiol ring-cleavage dioxygenase [Microbacterium]MDQ1113476.1 protocatechuate 3,4-dioxygenase beta subunit [Microbacterium testaceum]MDR6099423.1 protocatechuate 3,4-dioxygenase beta subunit [Microbacterium sp. SORGH_AS_0454]WAC68360.1 intradiol ring-cleavage dioxygenase [Microbacterium sp. SL75]
MSRIPDTQMTPEGPAYEGRLLDRADEPVVDQGAPFDIRTLVSRRRLLGLFAVGAGTATLAACAPTGTAATASPSATALSAPSPSTSTTAPAVALPAGEIPQETAGPYPGDGSNGADILERSGVVRSDLRSSLDGGATAAGVPMTLDLTILDMANGDVPLAGAAVYVWHCDAEGRYSMYSSGIQNETYLRGVQVVGADGVVSFTSIFPACYDGRWPHIHFEVYPNADAITDAANAIATSQVALPAATCDVVYADAAYTSSASNLSRVSLESDNVFGDDGGVLELATTTGDNATGWTVALTVRVDTTTTAAAGAMPGGR